jgi:capsular polysaccharide transport system permease protein
MMNNALHIEFRVVSALAVRNMRTKFGRTIFGPAILVAWPLSHALLLMLVNALVHRISPLGTDPAVFFSTGVLPYILCFYPARFIMIFSIHFNRGLLAIPAIKPLDLVLSEVLSQTVISFWVAALFLGILYIFGVDVVPERSDEAIFAMLATMYFGVALGALGAVIYGMTRAWQAVQILALIGMYFTSGALFLPEMLPKALRDLIWFNPLFHCVEWMRVAYYNDYSFDMLNRTYLLAVSTVLLWIALLIERGLRGRLMQQA